MVIHIYVIDYICVHCVLVYMLPRVHLSIFYRISGRIFERKYSKRTEIQVCIKYTVLAVYIYIYNYYRTQLEKCIMGRLNITWDHESSVIRSLGIEWDSYKKLSPEKYMDVLKRCYNNPGSSLFRSKELGLHHVNKGVYYDQLMRWYHCFPPMRSTARSHGLMGESTAVGSGASAVTPNHTYCIIYYEDFIADPILQYTRLLDCVGVDILSEKSTQVLSLLRSRSNNSSSIHSLKSPNTNTINVHSSWDSTPQETSQLPYSFMHTSSSSRSYNDMNYNTTNRTELNTIVQVLKDYYYIYNSKLDALWKDIYS